MEFLMVLIATLLASFMSRPIQVPANLDGVTIDHPVTVSMQPHKRHLPVLLVTVNGRGPYRFGLDTGAGGGGRIDPTLAAELGAAVVGEARSMDGTGKSISVKVFKVDHLKVGDVTFDGAVLAGRDAAALSKSAEDRLDGILGFGLFKDLLLTIDYPHKTVKFEKGSLSPGLGVIPISMEQGIANVDATLTGNLLHFHLDTGNDGGLILPDSMKDTVPLKGPLRAGPMGQSSHNKFQIMMGDVDGDLEVGSERFHDLPIAFAPVRSPNIGFEVLRAFEVTIDEAHSLMRLRRPQPKSHRTLPGPEQAHVERESR
jgi:predicted aspartyl protease